MKAVLLFAAALTLSACAATPTPYDAGAEAQKINDRAIRVSARGNDETPATTVSDYLLLKAAEEALKQNYPGFLILDRKDNSTYETAGIHLFHLPAQEAMVRFLTSAELKNTPDAFAAREVYASLAPRYIKSGR